VNNTIARLWDGAEVVGYILFSLEQVARRVSGHLWWRRFGPPFHVVNCMTVFQIDSPMPLWENGVMVVDDELLRWVESGIWQIEAWKAGKEEIPGPHSSGTLLTLRFEFLHGVEQDAAWAEFGWGDQ
jgi:hypothetical protein